ncbi:MAG: hypothetical protein J6V53_05690 [Alphaproteobacteria bacterium]|nr:hypothetical protein [Alphaproteobacteria bacterium]
MNIFTDTTRQSLTEEELTFQKKYGDKGIEIVPPFIAFQNGDYDYKKRKELLKNLSVNHLLIIAAANKSGMCVVAENFIFVPPESVEELNEEINAALKALVRKVFS